METETNPTAILAAQFSKIERTEIKVDGLPTLYSKPLNFEERTALGAVFKIDDPRKKSLKMCGLIVQHVVDGDGNKAFKNHNNLPAHQVLANHCDPSVVENIFAQVIGVDLGEDDELEEVSGKSSAPDSDS